MRITLTSLLVLVCIVCFSQTGHKIQIKVDGLKDTTAYLGYYYGESTFVRDTVRMNSQGVAVFEGKNKLGQGMYLLIVGKNTKLFDFLVSDDQEFSLATKSEDYVRHMVVTGDSDNKLFFENMHFNMARHKEAEPFIKIISDSTATADQKAKAREEFSKINEKVTQYQDDVIAKNPTSLTARLFKAHRPVQVPPAPKKANGSIDSTFQLKWYREHFFDNFDLSDDALIRIPQQVYQKKLDEYLDKLYVPQPDSLMKGINFIISKSKKNQETYKYSVWLCVIKYQHHEIMGLDEVYVNLIDEHFSNGAMDFWVNASMKKNLKEAADKMRVSLVGNIGDNLIMQDLAKQPRALYDIKNKYTLLFIFDPDCGHCREETPKLVNWYDKKKFDLEVYAVSLDTSMAKMRDYIKEMKMKWITVNGPRTYVGPVQNHYDASTTPALYILDNRRRIIAKKLPVDRVEEFLIQHERVEKLKAARKL
jgi:hypothetical protein